VGPPPPGATRGLGGMATQLLHLIYACHARLSRSCAWTESTQHRQGMRRSWKNLGYTMTPDDEASTTGEAQRGAEGQRLP
jgi:hypothetical protein